MTTNLDHRKIGPLSVAVLNAEAAIARIEKSVLRRSPAIVAFCNAHSVNLARNNPALAQSLATALVLNDGIGVDLASRLLYGAPFPENLNGTDFTSRLLHDIAPPLKLYLLGSRDGVAAKAATALAHRFPRHRIVGTHHGFFSTSGEERVRRLIDESQPDLILVGLGQPRQELWAENYVRDGTAVVLCVGAYLDFIAGIVPRAPVWIRRLRAEWMFRLAIEPRRLGSRYIVGNATFLWHAVRQKLGRSR